jgi:hypothetical protein
MFTLRVFVGLFFLAPTIVSADPTTAQNLASAESLWYRSGSDEFAISSRLVFRSA